MDDDCFSWCLHGVTIVEGCDDVVNFGLDKLVRSQKYILGYIIRDTVLIIQIQDFDFWM